MSPFDTARAVVKKAKAKLGKNVRDILVNVADVTPKSGPGVVVQVDGVRLTVAGGIPRGGFGVPKAKGKV